MGRETFGTRQRQNRRREARQAVKKELTEVAAALRATGRHVVTELRDCDADPASGDCQRSSRHHERGQEFLHRWVPPSRPRGEAMMT